MISHFGESSLFFGLRMLLLVSKTLVGLQLLDFEVMARVVDIACVEFLVIGFLSLKTRWASDLFVGSFLLVFACETCRSTEERGCLYRIGGTEDVVSKWTQMREMDKWRRVYESMKTMINLNIYITTLMRGERRD